MLSKVDLRTFCEIDGNAIKNNLSELKSLLNKDVGIMAVVKADGYGHGAVKVSEALIDGGISYLAVATIEEAFELRHYFDNIPILVLGFIPKNEIKNAISGRITLTVYNFEISNDISYYAKQLGMTAKVHIKMDTGMNRIGFWGSQLKEMYNLKNLENIEFEGIYTHFSCADCDHDYTQKQFTRFITACDKLKNNGFNFKYQHCCNSSAILNFPEMYLNMVRPGLIIYGLYPHATTDRKKMNLKPAMSLKTQISHIKRVPMDSKIGYGGTYGTTRDSIIATIPIGYADGYTRRLSNKANVLINGILCPVVGNICMDQCMVDVTDVSDINLLDEVVIIGRQGQNEISADDLAESIETISYEVITSIGKRVPRVFI